MCFFQVTVLVSVLIVAVSAAPPKKKPREVVEREPIAILSYNLDGPSPDGAYEFNYETENGIKAQEQGQLVNIAKDEAAMRVQGAFSYVDPDGNTIGLSYTADENGFQPEGAHLPTPPPIPPSIMKALLYIASHPEEDDLQ